MYMHWPFYFFIVELHGIFLCTFFCRRSLFLTDLEEVLDFYCWCLSLLLVLFAKCCMKLICLFFSFIILWSCCSPSYLLAILRSRNSGWAQLDSSFLLHRCLGSLTRFCSAGSWAGLEDPQRPHAHV